MSETKVPCDFQEPENLKDALELLAKLSDSVQAKKNVGQKLLKDVRKYCKETDKFYQSGSGSGFLSTVFSNAYGIRDSILQNSGTQYDKYNNLDSEHASHKDCALKISEALKKCLPKAFAALYFLLFMGDKSLGAIQGGKWHDQRCNGTGGFKNTFYNWLTDDSIAVTMEGLVARGFYDVKSSLTSQTAENVADAIKTILKHDSAGPLQNVLLYLLFSCEWHDSLLGHACLFLSTFCLKVEDDQKNFQNYFSSSDFQELKRVCLSLKENLKPFTHASGLPLYAVCHQNGTLYSAVWNPEAIPLYVKWLQGNLQNIIKSLTLMSTDCTQWDSENLQTAKTAGPFRFGFVFKDSWSDGTFKSQLTSKISSLTNSGPGSLQSLQKSLENFSTGNPGATAGGVTTGVLGAGGLGFGAAYATNAFGFQNFISGLISGFLK